MQAENPPPRPPPPPPHHFSNGRSLILVLFVFLLLLVFPRTELAVSLYGMCCIHVQNLVYPSRDGFPFTEGVHVRKLVFNLPPTYCPRTEVGNDTRILHQLAERTNYGKLAGFTSTNGERLLQ